MSPSISLRQSDGYTQGHRRTYTARQSDCSFYATLFMLYSLILDSEAFFFLCATLFLSVSLLSLFLLVLFPYYSTLFFYIIHSFTYVPIDHQFFHLIHLNISPTPTPFCHPHSYLIVIFPSPDIDLNLPRTQFTLTVGKKPVKFPIGWSNMSLLLQHRKWTCIWGIDFLLVLWEGDGSEVKAKSPAVDTHSRHNTGCSSIVRLVSLPRHGQ